MQLRTHRPPRKLFYGWVIVAVVAVAHFSQAAETFNVLGVFLKPITQEFHWSRSAFTGAMAVGSLLGGVVGLAMGPLMDRFGSRWALALAFLLLGATFFLMRWMTNLWEFYALQGLGRLLNTGVMGVAMMVIIPKWFIEQRGRAVALGGIGGSAGSSLLPLFVQFLVSSRGWRAATLGVGAIIWGVAVLPVAIFLRRQPEDMGLLPDGASPQEAAPRRATPSSPKGPGHGTERVVTLRQATHLTSFYLLTVNVALAWLIRTSITVHMVPYLTDLGLSPTLAVTVLAVHSGAGALGSLVVGFLVERYPIRWVLALDFLAITVGLLLMLSLTASPIALLWGFYWGLSQGSFTILHQVAFADYYGRRHLGSIQGAVGAVRTVTQAAGPVTAALAYDLTGGYDPIFLTFALAALVASACAFAAKPPTIQVQPPAQTE